MGVGNQGEAEGAPGGGVQWLARNRLLDIQMRQ